MDVQCLIGEPEEGSPEWVYLQKLADKEAQQRKGRKSFSESLKRELGLGGAPFCTSPASEGCVAFVVKGGTQCAQCKAKKSGMVTGREAATRLYRRMRTEALLLALPRLASRLARLVVRSEWRLEEAGITPVSMLRTDGMTYAVTIEGYKLFCLEEGDEESHLLKDYEPDEEAAKMEQAISQAIDQGADHVVYLRFNPDPIDGDGAPQLGITDRCTLAATALLQTVVSFAALPPAEAAQRSVRCSWLWYPGGLKHIHAAAAKERLAASLPTRFSVTPVFEARTA
ncbi:hypothetical protein COHA_005141 [Chlorella ohadii]|uniref:Uncharacterized protein n=1 Tax=Chlorella ohadii TaxID=2649997 RepID=A0AAD5H5N6_9CHLO|nr:hypothetical protein COHA_005141 [Chlorella ohadii]